MNVRPGEVVLALRDRESGVPDRAPVDEILDGLVICDLDDPAPTVNTNGFRNVGGTNGGGHWLLRVPERRDD